MTLEILISEFGKQKGNISVEINNLLIMQAVAKPIKCFQCNCSFHLERSKCEYLIRVEEVGNGS